MSEIKKSGGNKPLKMETHFKEIRVQQKPVGAYFCITESTPADKKKFFSDIRKLMYSKNKDDRQAAFSLIKSLKNDPDMKEFIKNIKAEEKAHKAHKK